MAVYASFEQQQERKKRRWRWQRTLLFVLFLRILLEAFFLNRFVLVDDSLGSVYQAGTRLWAQRILSWWIPSLQANDILILRQRDLSVGRFWIDLLSLRLSVWIFPQGATELSPRRLLAMPGEKIFVKASSGRFIVQALDSSFRSYAIFSDPLYYHFFDGRTYTLSQDEYWALPDHSDSFFDPFEEGLIRRHELTHVLITRRDQKGLAAWMRLFFSWV